MALSLSKGMTVVYPGHGICLVQDIKDQEISGLKMEVVVLRCSDYKMDITVPMTRIPSSGIRLLSIETDISQALKVLSSEPESAKAPWIRRQEMYERKINSGCLKKLAEVIRDLNQEIRQTEATYGAKGMLLKKALKRITQEVATVKNMTEEQSQSYIDKILVRRRV